LTIFIQNLHVIFNIIFDIRYNSIEEIKNNVVYAKFHEEVRKFYLDKSKNWEERIKAFREYGEKEQWIWHPIHPALNTIFNLFHEKDYIQKHEQVHVDTVIDCWFDDLDEGRIEISHRNEYHPSVDVIDRNYEPSKEALDKLWKMYYELLMIEGVSEYTYDW
jgi:hypothetical protein